MQSSNEKVWLAVEVGWNKPKEPPTTWDDTKIKAANFKSRALNDLFSAVTNEEFKKISSTNNAKEAWTLFRILMRALKLLRTLSFKGSLPALRKLGWMRMNNLMNSMPSSRT